MAPSAIIESVSSKIEECNKSMKSSQTVGMPVEAKILKNPALLHRSLLEQPHNVSYASGSYMTLQDGRKILDGCGGAAVAIIG